MKTQPRENTPRAAKAGAHTGMSCPVCGDSVLRVESGAGARAGDRLVCSKRGCPWQGKAQ